MTYPTEAEILVFLNCKDGRQVKAMSNTEKQMIDADQEIKWAGTDDRFRSLHAWFIKHALRIKKNHPERFTKNSLIRRD
jgi:hypothetical protein